MSRSGKPSGNVAKKCGRCGGNGISVYGAGKDCHICGGAGDVFVHPNSIPCRACGGKGADPQLGLAWDHKVCRGTGWVEPR